MFKMNDWFEIFNVPTIGLLAESWSNMPTQIKILSPFYFGDLFDKYPLFKESFVPVCSTCLLNSKLEEGLASDLSYDELMKDGKFEIKGVFLMCGHCRFTTHFHNRIADDISGVISRKKVIPSDVISIHIKVLDFFHLMSMGKVRDWKSEQEYLLSVLKCEIIPDNLLSDDVFAVSHVLECDDTSDIVICGDASETDFDYSFKNISRQAGASAVREYTTNKFSPNFTHLDGDSFIYPMSPLSVGLGVTNTVEGISEELNACKILPFEFKFKFCFSLKNIVNDKTIPFNGRLQFNYMDPYLDFLKIREINVQNNDLRKFECYAILRFSEQSKIMDFLNYHSAVYLNGYEDFLTVDAFHSLGKQYVVMCETSCTVMFVDFTSRDLICSNPSFECKDLFDICFIKVKVAHTLSNKKKFSFFDHGEKCRVNNMNNYYNNKKHQRTVLSKAYLNYMHTNDFSDITGYPITKKEFIGTDSFKRTLRFMCYRCFYHQLEGALIENVGCECNSQFSYSCKLAREMNIVKKHPLRYYRYMFNDSVSNGGLKYVINRSYSFNYVSKCQSCGIENEKVENPIFTDLKYCRGCLINHCGLPMSLASELKSNIDLLVSYTYDGEWDCPSCLRTCPKGENKILTRCIHEYNCFDCAGPLNICLNCKSMGCYG